MIVLDLFSGTGSVTKQVKKMWPDATVVSVDMSKVQGFTPTHLCDILEFNYEQYTPGYFDVVFAGVPCEKWSVWSWAVNGEPSVKALREARKVARKTLEIIDYLQPRYWFIENPWKTNLVYERRYNKMDRCRCDYCMYGFSYQKPTGLFTNFGDLTLKTCKGDCGFIGPDGRHVTNIVGRFGKRSVGRKGTKAERTGARAVYPPRLVRDIFTQVDHKLREKGITKSGRTVRRPHHYCPHAIVS